MLGDVIPRMRGALPNILFTDIVGVTEQHMSYVNFALYKISSTAPTEELQEGEFYQKTNDRVYLVHKLTAQNENLLGLVSLKVCTASSVKSNQFKPF